MNLKDVYNTILKESSLSRVWQLVQQDKYTFAIISASRGEFSPKENQSRTFELKKDVRKLGHGFIEMKGGYVETNAQTGEKVEVTEDSLLVVNISKEQAVELGSKFNQESILYKDPSGFEMISSKSEDQGKTLMSFKKSAGKDNLALAKDAVAQYFSYLKKGSHAGSKFAFVQEAEDWNWRKAILSEKKGSEKKWITILTTDKPS